MTPSTCGPADSPGKSDLQTETWKLILWQWLRTMNCTVTSFAKLNVVLTAVRTALLQGSSMSTPFCNQRQDNFVVERDCLYCQCTGLPVAKPYLQVVISSSLQLLVLKHLHNKMVTSACTRSRYFWLRYVANVEKWVRECEHCQRHNNSPQREQVPLGTIWAERSTHSRNWHRTSWAHCWCCPRVKNISWW